MDEETPHAARTAVVEAEGPTTLEVLQQTVQAKQEEYDTVSATYAELWRQRKAGNRDRMVYIDYLMAEDDMERLLRELEQLKPQLLFAEAEEAAREGKVHYDTYCAPVAEAAMLICATLAQHVRACARFVGLADERIRFLWCLPDHAGQPAFDLPDGAVLLQRLLSTVPGQQAGLVAMVTNFLRTPFTVGDAEQMVAQVGVQPFPEALVRRFLDGYQYDTPQLEGAEDASHC